MHNLKLKISNTEKRKEYYTAKFSKAEIDQHRLQSSTATLKNKIDLVEQEKKTFIAARKFKVNKKNISKITIFKEAQKSSQEKKNLEEKIDNENKEIGEIMKSKESYVEEINKTIKEIESLNDEQNDKIMEVNKNKYQIKKYRIDEIKQIIQTIDDIQPADHDQMEKLEDAKVLLQLQVIFHLLF